MATPDFTKIWGSNVATSDRYTFTDSDYLQGWAYVGSVPPAREAFDTLFRDIDTKMAYLNDELKNQSDAANEHDANAAAHNAMATTADDTLVPTSDTNTIRDLVSNLANRIKAATGAGGWKEAPAATLASLSTMIANLATGADVTWDGKKFTNHRLGITGLMDQNGYICFGPNCGNLIIQWGYEINVKTGNITYPISSETASIALATATSYSGNAASVTTSDCNKDGFLFFMDYTTNFRWTALCW
ncbi:hypothetical protein WMO23_05755 [Megasphaera sp. CLA-AA-H81]|uniref:Tail fiber protein n=1 Tax=Megasphaera intestinihominis TaxID=3133159 RepID=A0ABV1CWV1_9FIRM